MRAWLAICLLAAACGDDLPRDDQLPELRLERVWRSQDAPGCTIASPLLVESRGEVVLLAALASGDVVATSPADGGEVFRVELPAPAGHRAHVAATPGVSGTSVVIPYMARREDSGDRTAHLVAVLDLEARALDPGFPTVELVASVPAWDDSGDVEFLPGNAYSRSAVAIARPAGSSRGLAYVGFGNLQDIQPWHGWLFELDLDAWAAGDGAVSAVLLATPESDCGPAGESGADDMICGGGIWSPPGPTVFDRGDGTFELYVATGNGQLDLGRRDYANSVLRVGRGLAFDPACDPEACADFDPIDPARSCIESCRDQFIPRLLPGDPPFDPPDGRCDGKTFFECYALLDWDLGANTPARVPVPGGPDVLVVPAKDGGVYLADADHLGTLHDRIQLTAICGAGGGRCEANWAGTMVTVPVATTVGGTPLVLVPTFIFDDLNPAGLVGLAVVRGEDGAPRWEKRWEAPAFSSAEAVERFRGHVGRVALVTLDGAEYAALVDPGPEQSRDGILYLVRVADGSIAERAALDGPGRKYTLPAVRGDTIYVASCDAEDGASHLEAWRPRRF
ncbi:MAG TPA: hypothetical protein VFU21_11075 [Kofleriaceae bacterium]|nr:hypothetical protein [Kofleriaceae bacterium]